MPAAASATKAGAPAAPGTFIDPQALMRIKSLELRARAVVEGFWHGLHRSPYHGFSVEFTEYRAYTPGDDLRYLDWKLAGRTDRYFIKRFEDETNLRCHLVVDRSKSMAYGSTGYTKADYAVTLAATLAYFLEQQGDALGVLTFDQVVRDYLPARHRPGHLRQAFLALDQPPGGQNTDLAAPLRKISELVRKRGVMVLISDLLADLDEVENALGLLAASGHETIVFQVLDPAEIDFPFTQASRFVDAETGRELFIEPERARADYRKRFDEHQEAMQSLCRRLGVTWNEARTDAPVETLLFDFLRSRAQRGKTIRRRGQTAA